MENNNNNYPPSNWATIVPFIKQEFPLPTHQSIGNSGVSYIHNVFPPDINRNHWHPNNNPAHPREQYSHNLNINQAIQSNVNHLERSSSNKKLIPKLLAFTGEINLTRLQRAEVIIPTDKGVTSQTFLLLPLKRKEQNNEMETSNKRTQERIASQQQYNSYNWSPSPGIEITPTQSVFKKPDLPSSKRIKYSYELGDGTQKQRYEGSVPLVTNKVSKPSSKIFTCPKMTILANSFKQRRKQLGLTQMQAATALKDILGPNFSQNSICRFEKLELSPAKFWKIQSSLEEWITEVEMLNVSCLKELSPVVKK